MRPGAMSGNVIADIRGSGGMAIVTLLIMACGEPEPIKSVWVGVPEGASIEAVAESLLAHQVIGSADAFNVYVRMAGKSEALNPGIYRFKPGTPIARVVDAMVLGVAPAERLTVPAGARITEIATLVEDRLGISAAEFEAACSDPQLIAEIGAGGKTVEGYLYPTTYYIRVTADADAIVRQMIDEFEASWIRGWSAAADSLGLRRDEIITLASIIEGEGPGDGERTLVSSVYHNRLSDSIPLQADPTVVYALQERRRLFNIDYQFASPFNTYLFEGLPPSPIGQPSSASIDAALHPADSDYYYFVAGPDGRHEFSSTFEEHLETISSLRDSASGRPTPQTP